MSSYNSKRKSYKNHKHGSYNNDNRNNNRDKKNGFIEYPVVKKGLIDYLYSIIELSRYKYKIVEEADDLTNITKQHSVGYSYNGMSCFLLFTKQREKFYSCLINRSTLSYDRSNVKDEDVVIIPLSIRVEKEVYNGTVFDGTLLKSEKGTPKTFVINDVYRLSGINKQPEKICYKQMQLDAYLNNMVYKDEKLNNVNLLLNKFSTLDKIKELHDDKLNNKFSNDINGFVFYPNYSGVKIIYRTDIKTPVKKTSSNNSVINKNHNTEFVFEMRKTETPDVYLLFLFSIAKKTKVLTLKEFNTAYVPTTECSQMCSQFYKDDQTDAIVICKYLIDKKKWLPLKKKPLKNHPDSIKRVRKMFKSVLEN